MSKTETTENSAPCEWRGGNDYMECAVCGIEYDYRCQPQPPCGSPSTGPEMVEVVVDGARAHCSHRNSTPGG
jgi:hypothetical protein